MSDSTIEWTDKTWNPVTGCIKVSPGCKNCYAEGFAERFRGPKLFDNGRPNPYHMGFDPTLRPERLKQPFEWAKPCMVFVNSMSDLFGEFVPDDYLAQVFEVMRQTTRHTYQILTKRHERMRDWTRKNTWLLQCPHIWLGVSVEDKKYGLPRVDALREVTAAIRFLSIEPLLEDVADELDLTGIDWVIVGGESGPGYRLMHPDWARGLRDKCVKVGVRFFFKKWGGHPKGKLGRMLDGRTWDEFPER